MPEEDSGLPGEDELRAQTLEAATNDLEVNLTGQITGKTVTLQLDAVNNGPNPVDARSTVTITGGTFATPIPVQCSIMSPTQLECAHVNNANDPNEPAFSSNTDKPTIPMTITPTDITITATAVVRDTTANATDPIPTNNTKTIATTLAQLFPKLSQLGYGSEC
jgi:hypothetical protein